MCPYSESVNRLILCGKLLELCGLLGEKFDRVGEPELLGEFLCGVGVSRIFLP